VLWLVSASVAGAFAVLLVLQFVFAWLIFGAQLSANEDQAAREKVTLVAGLVTAAKARLSKTVNDYAPWSPAIGYLEPQLKDLVRQDAESGARLDRLMFDVDAFLGPDQQLLLGFQRGPQARLNSTPLGAPPRPSQALMPADFTRLMQGSDLASHLALHRPASGYMQAEGTFWIWAIAPVMSHGRPEQLAGWWVAARDLQVVLDETADQRLSGSRTLLVLPAGSVQPQSPQIVARTTTALRLRALISHIDAQHELVLELVVPRDGYMEFRSSTRFFIVTRLLIDVTVVLLLLLMLNAKLLRPLRLLSQQLEALADMDAVVSTPTALSPAHISPEIRRIADSIDTLLETRRLRQVAELARDAARTADLQKSSIIATLSHELRTPLQSVIGMTELLIASPLRMDQQAQAAVLQTAVMSLQSIADEALTMSTLQAGQLQLNLAPANLRTLLQDLCEVHLTEALRKGLSIQWSVDAAVEAAHLADAVRLRQVLGNLIGNAIKFTEQGVITVALTLMKSAADVTHLKFSVTDAGPGLDPEFQQRALKLFSQSPAEPAPVNDGVGLGLGIVKSLVDLMGGTVALDTLHGAGATFSFVLALPPSEPPTIVPAPATTADSRACRVLLVDDNAAGRQVSGSLLAHLGAMVTPATSGAEGLESYTATPEAFDLILMDVRMPIMDGHEATRRLRAWEQSHLPPSMAPVQVVALTANSAPSDQLQARAAGMDGYLTKPVRLIDLRNLLRSTARRGNPAG
jgi:signal transduction histidine kinase/ActR/RegA family two-component response regulator